MREVFLTKKPSRAEAARILTEKLKFPVSAYSVEHAQKATGISWEPKKQTPLDAREKHHVTRTLCNAVIALYQDLGKPIPASLEALSMYAGRKVAEADSATISMRQAK